MRHKSGRFIKGYSGYAIYRRSSLPPKQIEKQPTYRDLVAIIGGLGLYALLYYFHAIVGGIGLS